ncbi:hypothetical protein CsSME_00000874 [Camellia sinensis var. sinensis]
MDVSKRFELLILLFMILAISQYTTVEARAISLQHPQRYSKEFANNLGVVCDCCDGEEGDQCRSSWEGSCSKLRCLPWKYH